MTGFLKPSLRRAALAYVVALSCCAVAPAAWAEPGAKVSAASRLRIATFDSGFGGFFTAKAIEHESHRILAHYDAEISITHYGDTANTPYGEKTPEQIALLGSQGVLHAFKEGADIVFIACNTASTQYERIREHVERHFPGRGADVVSIVDASVTYAREVVESSLAESDQASIAILATPATVKSMIYPRRLADRYGAELRHVATSLLLQERWLQSKGLVVESATQVSEIVLPDRKTIRLYQLGPGNWVDLIEGDASLRDKHDAIHRDLGLLSSLLPAQSQVDGVGYFCTHYPALERSIQLEMASLRRSTDRTQFITQAPLMAGLFRQWAEGKLAGRARRRPVEAQELQSLLVKARPTIELTGNNVAATRKLARTLFPNDPAPVIKSKPRRSSAAENSSIAAAKE